MNKIVLITGANGQLGLTLRDSLISYNNLKYDSNLKYRIFDISSIFNNPIEFVTTHEDQETIDFVFADSSSLDIRNSEALIKCFKLIQPDFIINAAAYTNVDRAEDEKVKAFDINEKAVRNLVNLTLEFSVIKKRWIQLIHISTDYVFNGCSTRPYLESDQTNPMGIYGLSKLGGELAIINSKINYLILRTSWLYSTRGHNFFKTIQRLTSEKEELQKSLRVVSDQIGTPTYARDLADFILDYIKNHRDKEAPNKIYHFSNEGTASWYDFAVEIARLLENKCDIQACSTEDYPTRAKRPKYSILDKQRIKTDFKISIRDWRLALRDCVELFKQG